MKEIYINNEDIEWEEAKGYPTGTMIKIFREDGEPHTFLLKLPSDFKLGTHSHTATEQHLVLEGEYISNDKTYGKGSYRLIPAGMTHGPFSSEHSAVILVIRDPQ